MSELEANQLITSSFLVHSKEVRQKKSGELYLSLILGDRTGDLDGKMWDNVNEVVDSFDRDDFVKVKGMIQIFHNRRQLTIHKLRRMDASEVEFSDYFPSSKRDPQEMWTELRSLVSGMQNPHLKALLEGLLDDEDIARRYRMAPAAKQIHHAFLGGLLEHVLSLCGLARLVGPHYAGVDGDLLLTGVVLHDIGKIYELNYERGFSYSTEGQLIGHISIAMRMVDARVRDLPGFPPKLLTLVEHMILSHHGQLEYGSPKLPLFPEALLLHYLDDMDSKMECMRALIENDRQVEGCFTAFNAALARPALKLDRYWDPVPPRTESAPVPPRTESAPAPARTDSAPVPPRTGIAPVPPPADSVPAAPRNGASPAPPPVAVVAKSDSPFAEKLRRAVSDPAAPKQDA